MIGQPLEWIDAGDDIVAFSRGPIAFMANISNQPYQLPVSGEVVFRSGDEAAGSMLGPDEAAIVRIEPG